MLGDYSFRAGYSRITAPTTVAVTIPLTAFDTAKLFGVRPSRFDRLLATPGTTVIVPGTSTANVFNPIFTNGAFKIGDNESPQPQDRIFVNYNYLYNVAPGNLRAARITDTDTRPSAALPTFVGINGSLVPIPTTAQGYVVIHPGTKAVVAPLDLPRVNANEEVFGVEKVLPATNASLGVRIPVIQPEGDANTSTFGDVTVILKVAVCEDKCTGDVLSTGVAVTIPTGHSIFTTNGDVHSTLLQPFVGFYKKFDDLYVQGFSAVMFPSKGRDASLLFEDLAIGWYMWRSSAFVVNSIIPTVEAHYTYALEHRVDGNPVVDNPLTVNVIAVDLLNLTAGVHIGLGDRALVTFGAFTPVTGPRPFDLGALAQVNLRF
jgi:hypothetical protein